ncbi:MAG: nitrite/sulfite reductase [Mycobacteriales bacterium]
MPPNTATATRPRRPAKAGRAAAAKRGEGQWALGYREPLNGSEQMKKDNDGLAVRDRIVDIYSKRGFASIDPQDLRGRFRWYGLYTQRAPDIPGGRTASLEPEELEDSHFMLRVRVDGGHLGLRQLRTVAGIAKEFGRDVADITDRQNIQLHWIRIEDVPEIWRRLEEVGLSTTEACGDVPRVMLGCPLGGVAEDEILDATPYLDSLAAEVLGNPEFSNLPRKYKTSISGCAKHCTNHEINDVSFVGVVGPDGEPGFDLWVGGGLSTNPMFAQRLGAFVAPDRVAEVWRGVTGVFRDYGYRRSRTRARLKFLLADWGTERFREVLEKDYLDSALPDGPAPAASPAYRDHIGVHRQHDVPGHGACYSVGAAPRAGRTSGTQLSIVADLAEQAGAGRVHTTAQQHIVVLDVPEKAVESLVTALEDEGLPTRPSQFRRGTIACTGLEFCKLAIVETKARADWLAEELTHRIPELDTPITINVNGCPNACARFQVADIGFKGMMMRATGPEGDTQGGDGADGDVEGFQVHLGGQLGTDAAFGRKFRGLRVRADELADYSERVVRGYLARRADGESFAAYAARAEQDWLT